MQASLVPDPSLPVKDINTRRRGEGSGQMAYPSASRRNFMYTSARLKRHACMKPQALHNLTTCSLSCCYVQIAIMAGLCKACGVSLSEKKGDWKSLTGDAAGVHSVCSILILLLTEGCPRYQQSIYHEYLSKEPAFVCKSCFNLLRKYSNMRDNLEAMRSKITRDFNDKMSCSSNVSQHKINIT